MGRLHTRSHFLLKLAIALGLACFCAVFYFLYTREDVVFAYLKSHLYDIQVLVEAHRVLAWVSFTLFYLLYVGFFLPGTAVLSLAGGAVFGFWPGLACVSVGRGFGAAMAFLLSKAVLRDWALARHGSFIAKIDAAVARDGPYYLFFLRLAPVAPYNLTNMAMGLTDMPLLTYFAVTLVGMLPRALLWVNAGSQLATLNALSDAASPRVLLSLLALGLFPLLAKLLVRRLRGAGA